MNVNLGTRRRVLAIVALGLLVVAAVGLALVRTSESENKVPQISPADGDTIHLAVWEEDRGKGDDIYGARVTGAGVVLDRRAIPISSAKNTQMNPVVAFDGTNFLVVWTDKRSAKAKVGVDEYDTYDVYGARVSRAGQVLDPAGIPISTAGEDQTPGGVGFGGNNFLVVWSSQDLDGHNIHGTRVSRSGAVLDKGGFAISTAEGDQTYPTVAFDGSNFLVAWSSSARELYDVFAARVSPAGRLLDPAGLRISKDAGTMWAPSVASGRESTLIAWTQWSEGGLESIFGARVSRDGTVLDPEGLVIGPGGKPKSNPLVAFDGTTYLVVCNNSADDETSEVYAARVNEDGKVLDSAGRAISPASGSQWVSSIAYSGSSYFVTWWQEYFDEYGPLSPNADLFAVRVDESGAVLTRPKLLTSIARD